MDTRTDGCMSGGCVAGWHVEIWTNIFMGTDGLMGRFAGILAL